MVKTSDQREWTKKRGLALWEIASWKTASRPGNTFIDFNVTQTGSSAFRSASKGCWKQYSLEISWTRQRAKKNRSNCLNYEMFTKLQSAFQILALNPVQNCSFTHDPHRMSSKTHTRWRLNTHCDASIESPHCPTRDRGGSQVQVEWCGNENKNVFRCVFHT